MALGYDGKLYILAFDHRGSFQKKMFEHPRRPDARGDGDGPRRQEGGLRGHGARRRARRRRRRRRRARSTSSSARTSPSWPRSTACGSSMPVEKSGQDEFDFQFGDAVRRAHRAVRPGLREGARPLQPRRRRRDERAPARAAQAARRLAARERPQVPVRAAGAGREGPARLGRRRHRPLRRRAAAGADAPRDRGRPRTTASRSTSGRSRASTPARTPRCSREQTRKGEGRENVVCVLLGRGASDAKVDHWLQQAAPVEGFIGFAIGRSIWWDALKGFLDGRPRARGGRRADRRELPALREGVRRRGVRRAGVATAVAPILQQPARPVRGAALEPCGAWRRRPHRPVRRGGRPARRPRGAGAARRPRRRAGAVVRVVDGDTIRVRLGGARGARALHRGRHAGDRQARHAGAVLRQGGERVQRPPACATRSVRLVFDAERRDRYGRLLAYVYRSPTGCS